MTEGVMMFERLGRIIVLTLAAAVLAAGAAFAQDDGGKKKKELVVGKWYFGLDLGLVLSQASYTENWNGGESGQIAWTWILNSQLQNQFHKKLNWLNTLKLAFGQTHNQRYDDGDVRYWDRPEKTTDLIDFESLLRFTLESWVDPYLAFRGLSQFLDNTDPFGRDVYASPISMFLSGGVAREFYRTEDEMFLSRLGGAFRRNIRQYYPNLPPDDSKKTETSHDVGIEWVTDYKIKVLEDKVLWTSKLTVYKPFEYSFRGDLGEISPSDQETYGIDGNIGDYPLAVDVNWENIFSAEVTSWLNFNLYFMFVYDKYDNSVVPEFDENGDLTNPIDVRTAVRKAGQIKQTLAVGLAFKLL
jgi:hypothetical protein